MFESIKINNLRVVTELQVERLGQVNLFVGRNNCGKTTLLEGIFFLVGATNPQLPVNANRFRGLEYLQNELLPFFFNNVHSQQNIRVSAKLRGGIKRELKIRSIIEERQVYKQANDGNSISTPLENGDSAPLLRLGGLEFVYQSSNMEEPIVSTLVLKEKIEVKGRKEGDIRGVFVSPSTRFDWKFRFGSIQRKKKENELVGFLSEIDSSLIDIKLNEVGILEADVGLQCRIPVNLMGGGIASCLSVALAMLDTNEGIVLIDEFETGLHHSIQEKLWKAVFKWAEKLNVQVFATTHSYECINAFMKCSKERLFGDMAKLFRIEREANEFSAVEFGMEDLGNSLENMWEIR